MAFLQPLTSRVVVVSLAVALLLGAAPARAVAPTPFPQTSFPDGYDAYHTYAEMEAALDDAVADHPQIVRKLSIGRSYEGRQLWAAKISDNVAVDEDEPETFFDSLIHGREHLTVEMNLYLLRLLTDGYGSDRRITDIVDGREIWLVFMVNPDGGEHDIAGEEFAGWRKNRQPVPGSREVGVDLNRNFGFKWGCCDGSSAKPADETYRGWRPWVAPEVTAYRDFIRSRVVDGRQQIRVAVSWHTAGELILWPYGYTADPTVRTMTADDRQTFEALGAAMAALNGYTAKQSTNLYVTDGDQTSWSHYEQRIFHFTFELFPAEIDFYPDADNIGPQTERNREAVLFLLEHADCPYRVARLHATRCGPLDDDLEMDRGWVSDPNGTDTATMGGFERGVVEGTAQAGVKQPSTAASGERAFISGARAGAAAAANDLDGTTSVLSPEFVLPAGTDWRLSFRSLFAHDQGATTDDYLRVSVVDGDVRVELWRQAGRAEDLDGAWTPRSVELNAFVGRPIRLLFEALDAEPDGLLEAGFDDVRVHPAERPMGPDSHAPRTHVPGLYMI